MKKATGVYISKKKNGETYYRSSITYQNRHISLGSYPTFEQANHAYFLAHSVLNDSHFFTIEQLESLYFNPACSYEQVLVSTLAFDKMVILINFRDNHIYFHNPIYLKKNYFFYFLDASNYLIFDKEDLFYYSSHKIMKRGGHLFVADYGMQINILSRYGIKNHAVKGRDYVFLNNDENNFRYSNVRIINRFYGVTRIGSYGEYKFKAKIHVKGDIVLGIFLNEETAAIAYNKAADYCNKHGILKKYNVNYIEGLSPKTYAEIYAAIELPEYLISYCNQ